MQYTDVKYNGGELSFRLPHDAVKEKVIVPLRDAGIINLDVHYRHYDSPLKKGDSVFILGLSNPPFINASLERRNGPTDYSQIKFDLPSSIAGDKEKEYQGRLTMQQIAKILGIDVNTTLSQAQ